MRLSVVFIANAAFALFGSLSLLLAPQQTMSAYGAPLSDGGLFVAHILGAVVLGIAVMSFLAREVKDKNALQAILTGAVIAHGGSVIFALMAVLSGSLNQMTWIDVAIHGAFAAAFGYYLVKRVY